MEAKLTIRDLEMEVVIGIRDKERLDKQKLVVTIELIEDITCASDNLIGFVDYSELQNRIVTHVVSRSYNTIEAVAYAIASILAEIQLVRGFSVQVRKNNISITVNSTC